MCRLFSSGKNNAFTDGFNDWKNVASAIKSHEGSTDHRDCMTAWISRKTTTVGIEQAFQTQYEKNREYLRNILRRVVSIVRFLSQRGLAFKGDVQQLDCTNNGNFLGCLEYLSEYDQMMSNHIQHYGNKGRGNPSYLSWNICDEVIDLMASKVQTVIVSDIKHSKYFAVSVDSTPDLSHTDQLTVVVRYLSRSGEVQERFLQFIDIYGHSAENLFDVITTTLRRLNIPHQ